MIEFIVYGKPVGKGRPRFSSRSGTAYTPTETKAYEFLIANTYLDKYKGFKYEDKDVPLQMLVKAYYPIPKSDSKKVKEAKEDGRILPSRQKPDIDNVLKVVQDALEGIVFDNDTQIVEVRGYKYFSSIPRIEVSIKEVKP